MLLRHAGCCRCTASYTKLDTPFQRQHKGHYVSTIFLTYPPPPRITAVCRASYAVSVEPWGINAVKQGAEHSEGEPALASTLVHLVDTKELSMSQLGEKSQRGFQTVVYWEYAGRRSPTFSGAPAPLSRMAVRLSLVKKSGINNPFAALLSWREGGGGGGGGFAVWPRFKVFVFRSFVATSGR